jgi:hypothetical protein
MLRDGIHNAVASEMRVGRVPHITPLWGCWNIFFGSTSGALSSTAGRTRTSRTVGATLDRREEKFDLCEWLRSRRFTLVGVQC